jgi:hypothetical protein
MCNDSEHGSLCLFILYGVLTFTNLLQSPDSEHLRVTLMSVYCKR